jgi:hypothetical protein
MMNKLTFMLLLMLSMISSQLLAQNSLPPNCFNPTDLSCHFYHECVETVSPCGEDGYALGYGEKYCERFLLDDNFSANGKKWRDQTLLCLQRQLVPVVVTEIKTPASYECHEITNIAFNSHPHCYTGDGPGTISICQLPLSDLRIIKHTIYRRDLYSSRSLRQIRQVAKTCVAQILFGFRNIPTPQGPSFRSRSLTPEIENTDSELKARLEFWQELSLE